MFRLGHESFERCSLNILAQNIFIMERTGCLTTLKILKLKDLIDRFFIALIKANFCEFPIIHDY